MAAYEVKGFLFASISLPVMPAVFKSVWNCTSADMLEGPTADPFLASGSVVSSSFSISTYLKILS